MDAEGLTKIALQTLITLRTQLCNRKASVTDPSNSQFNLRTVFFIIHIERKFSLLLIEQILTEVLQDAGHHFRKQYF